MAELRPKILLLDSDEWLSDALTSSLVDFSVVRVSDIDKAFDAIDEHKPNLILSDVMLGSRNLFALLNEMQSHLDTRDLPIVIISSLASRIKLGDVKSLGVRAVLDKSTITPETLNRKLLDIFRSEEEASL